MVVLPADSPGLRGGLLKLCLSMVFLFAFLIKALLAKLLSLVVPNIFHFPLMEPTVLPGTSKALEVVLYIYIHS